MYKIDKLKQRKTVEIAAFLLVFNNKGELNDTYNISK